MRTKKEGGCGKAHVIRSLLHGATYGKESDSERDASVSQSKITYDEDHGEDPLAH